MAKLGEMTLKIQVEHLHSFVPAYYYDALVRKTAREMAKNGYIMINDMGDAITYEAFERMVADANNELLEQYTEEEWRIDNQERVRSMARILGVQADDDVPWKQEYLTTNNAQLGWFPNPTQTPPAPVQSPQVPVTKASEPEYGVVIAGTTQLSSSEVSTFAVAGKFIGEGEQIDTSFSQYIVVFRNDDYNRAQAVQVRNQLRDLIRGVDVVLVPLNGG